MSGLKFPLTVLTVKGATVSPYTGEWIEIPIVIYGKLLAGVSPYTGEWIEICDGSDSVAASIAVSPYIGEWIEIV